MRLDTVQSGGGGLAGSLARAGLGVLAGLWGAGHLLRRGAYAKGLRRRAALGLPTISVGNLAVGGTGKTPLTAFLARGLAARGRRPGILARGYGGRARDGALSDEGAVRARLVPHVPQAEDRDRRRGARSLRAAHPEVDVFVLDDAFQHFAVRRDLDVVLLDATRPLARDHLLPRGRLREGPSALARAGLVVLTRADLVGEEALAEQEGHARRFTAAPFLRAASRASGVEVGGRTEPATWLRGRAVHALSGLGNPDAFVRTLERAGARVVGRRDLGDHAAPSDERFLRYAEEGLEGGAEWVVVTRKDAVKRGALPARVAVLDVEAEILAGEDLLWRRVGEALAAGRGEGGREGAG